MPRIFISYRRLDTKHAAGRLDDHLRGVFGKHVLRGVESNEPGGHFKNEIMQQIATCDVVLVIIGEDWVTARLQDQSDLLRLEIEAALERPIPVIPVLVDGVPMPTPDQLPESLRPLLERNAFTVDSGKNFRTDVERLIAHLRGPRRWTPILAAVGAAICVSVAFAAYRYAESAEDETPICSGYEYDQCVSLNGIALSNPAVECAERFRCRAPMPR